jgi:fluoride exporter
MNLLRDFLLLALGGGLGAMTRYAIGLGTQYCCGKQFPWGTLVANVLGCLIVGIVGQRVLALEQATANATLAHFLRIAVMVGFLGGLTTFSAFGWETMSRLFDQEASSPFVPLVNVAANVFLGLAAVWLGMQLARSMAPVGV